MTNYKMKNGSTSIEKIFENCETKYYKINSISGNSFTKNDISCTMFDKSVP